MVTGWKATNDGYTTAPALQFYSGNYLAGTPSAGRNCLCRQQGWRWKANCCRTARIILNGPQPDGILRHGEVRQPDRVSSLSVLTICRYMPDDASLSGLHSLPCSNLHHLRQNRSSEFTEPYTAHCTAMVMRKHCRQHLAAI
ncbi:hypothetical protein KCP69_20700 [Salmonella enterica subsp. enterica]|nr:hypothetical protein KCP69_20700 [Salmonella enterica subsp. enterica]